MESEPPLAVRVAAPNGPVYEDECVELFVSDAADPARYLELVVNPLGVLYAARVHNPEGSRASWEIARGVAVPGVRAAAGGEGEQPGAFRRWSATIEVPWDLLGGVPRAGETRRGNVTRIARGRRTRFEALSPTLRSEPPDFHVPARFARLTF